MNIYLLLQNFKKYDLTNTPLAVKMILISGRLDHRNKPMTEMDT